MNAPTSPALTPSAVTWPDAAREAAFQAWFAPLVAAHGLRPDTLAPASADASFRRYLRVQGQAASCIVMDAPPPLEDVRPFLDVARRIQAAGLHGPQVLAADAEQGFLLLDDLGHTLYLTALKEAVPTDPARVQALMRDAIAALLQWQTRVDPAGLPAYDEALLRRELALFPDWCVQREFGITWGDKQRQHWDTVCQHLVASALAQPRVAVHRDWMPRNLMVSDPNPAILDFQDAVLGPITYDPASLLRDAFMSWDEDQEIDWAVRWWDGARQAGLFGQGEAIHPMGQDFGECWRAMEWMGLQRHLKVLGIFCRLKHRDGKPAYAQDLPRFFHYATKVAMRYRPLAPLLPLLEPLSGQALASGFTF